LESFQEPFPQSFISGLEGAFFIGTFNADFAIQGSGAVFNPKGNLVSLDLGKEDNCSIIRIFE
jgi:hypothetical protein